MTKEAKIVTGMGVGIIALFAALVYGASQQPGGSNPPPSENNGTNAAISLEVLARPDSHASASTPTRVTITEFGDYQCPACGVAYPIVKDIIKNYKGRATLVFRNYPLDSHPNGRVSAEAAEAAGLQGKFWEMHGMIYERQPEWSNEKNPLPIFMGYAKTLGLNTDQFQKDMRGDAVTARIKTDVRDGQTVKVGATPTFFVNTKPFVGIPTKEFFELLDAELSAKQ